ncbi:MAG TPA: folylpolyglutamate synthase/dihydrofolate synthase family protein [Phycisphaerae bacterium]|jgi:dihydrofolate synthase/folylpolyglutamate synthase
MARTIAVKAKRSRITKPRTTSASNGSSPVRTFKRALTYLSSVTDFERSTRLTYNSANFNLARMNRLLTALGNPQRLVRMVHVAGTKGKGSTATMIARMLEGAGYKTGLYTSPHVLSVRERIAINNTLISEAAFARCVGEVARAAAKSKVGDLTYFEVLTAAAFLHFAREKCELAVIEVGLGGRLDSTNVIKPEVCAITNISFDHMSVLGKGLAAIAEEKAGIIKPGVPVISAPQQPEVKAVLRRIAEKNNAPLTFLGEDVEFSIRFESSRTFGPHNRVCLTTPTSRFEHLHVPLLGEHQAINCGVALAALDALKARGVIIDDVKATDGLANTRLIGRMEMLYENPRIIADGAHNAASVEALMRAIGQSISYDSMVVIFGCQKDKDVVGMLQHVQLGADKIIFTGTGSPRSMDPAELAMAYAERTGKMVQVAETLADALAIADRAVSRDDLICITGSFYLVAQAKRLFADDGGKRLLRYRA